MRRVLWFLLLLLVLASPRFAQALELHWIGGSNNLSFSQNTRAVLTVRADSAEVSLPGSWRLQWTADSSGIQFVAPDSLEACLMDTASVAAVDPPLTQADSVANLTTAHFCSYGTGTATAAHFVVDLIGGSRGKLKVVALSRRIPP